MFSKTGNLLFKSAFEDLSGITSTAHRQLLTDILRGEWGFDGFVVSDWSSIPEVIQHGIAADSAEAAALCLHPGVEMDMVGNAYIDNLESMVINGQVPLIEIDEAVKRIIRIKLRAGLFENPYTEVSRAARDIIHSGAIVLVIGEYPLLSGEKNKVADLGLLPGQKELVLAASRLGKPLIIVVLAGRVLAIPDEIAAADAVLFVFHPEIGSN